MRLVFRRVTAPIWPRARRGSPLLPFPLSLLVVLTVLALTGSNTSAQAVNNADVQVHGYATQGFLYTTQNNIFTTDSSDGSGRWTDAIVNIGAVPTPRMRVGAQARYFLFGKYSHGVSLDWAQVDYKFNEHFGIRAGKVKTPAGLFNEVQDIDPAYIWCLLPQSVYPIFSRNSVLAHTGGVVYGAFPIEERLGKLEYRGWGGHQVIGADDGVFQTLKELGGRFPNGIRGPEFGAALRWKTPLPGLTVGASDIWRPVWVNTITVGYGAITGRDRVPAFYSPDYFASYDHGRISAAAEFTRNAPQGVATFANVPSTPLPIDNRNRYAMASYKATKKLTTGLYFSDQVNRALRPGPARCSKDWAIAGHYDVNQFVYVKAEQHFIDGTSIGYDVDLNSNGLKSDTRLTILKVGFSF